MYRAYGKAKYGPKKKTHILISFVCESVSIYISISPLEWNSLHLSLPEICMYYVGELIGIRIVYVPNDTTITKQNLHICI